MPVSDFGQPRSREHTFSTGRTAVLLESCPMQALVRSGVLSDELLETFEAITDPERAKSVHPRKALEVSDLLVRTMWLEPKVGDPATGAISLDVIDDREADETVLIALLGAQGAARFRAESERAGAGDSSEDVAAGTVADGGAPASDV